MKIWKSCVPGVLVSLLLTACMGPGGRAGGPDGGMGRNRDGGEDSRRIASGGSALSVVDSVQEQLRATAEDLKLTPTQWPLWEAYQEKVGALMTDMMRLEGYQRPNQTATQLIGVRVNTVRNRLTAMEEIAEAADRLYKALDAEQRKIADQRLAATVPALYSGLGGTSCGAGGEGMSGRGSRGGGMPGSGRGGQGGQGGMPGRF